jgi:uncharacterized membrane protein
MTEETQNNDPDQIAAANSGQRSDPEVAPTPKLAPVASERQNWLKTRVNKWRESGIISGDQSEAILNYEAAPEEPFRLGLRFNRLIVVLATLGAILIGAGIISFVAANWQGIPSIAKLALLIGGQIATYVIAFQLQFVRGYPRIGGAIMFTGAAWFGANVFLVAQSYHLPTDSPELLIWWFLGILPLAYIVRSNAITVMAVGIFTVGLAWKAATWADDSENFFGVVGILLLSAATIYAIGMLHLVRQKIKFHADPYLAGGALLAIGVTYILTFAEVFRDSSREINNFQTIPGSQIVLTSIVTITAAIALGASYRLSSHINQNSIPRFAETAVVVLVVALGWVLMTHPFNSIGFYVVSFNLLLVLLIFGTITLGIVNKREALVNIGIIFFVIDLATRYIELTVDMLDTSLAFIIGGLLLLGVGYGMERARRKLLTQFGLREVNHDS